MFRRPPMSTRPAPHCPYTTRFRAWVFRIQGLHGLPAEKGEQRLGYPVLGCDEDLPTLALPDTNALVCLGQIKSPEPRMQLFARLRELGYILPAIVAPTAWVSPYAYIGEIGRASCRERVCQYV